MRKSLLFKVYKGKGYFKVITIDGEIVDIDSPAKTYNMDNLEETLKVAVKVDFEQFLELTKSLRLDTAHYKMAKKILKETKNEMEVNIKKIMQLIPE